MSEPLISFTTAVPYWRPRITPLDIEEASDEQLEAMKVTTSNTKIGEFTLVLALDPETLLHFTPLLNGIMSGQGGLSRPETELGAVSASVVNRSIYCAAAHSNRYNQLTKDDAVMDSILSSGEAADISPRQKALLLFSSKLSKCPSEATKSDVERLSDNRLNMDEVLDLVFAASLFSWVNRLSHVLGDPLAQS
jgi:uncharacterized peroxidase-related enzyme